MVVELLQAKGDRNEGHGHVFTRPDGVRARCGGPALCAACQQDREKLRQLFIARDRGAMTALKQLETAASEVARKGAVSGSQWSGLTIALLKARVILNGPGA